MEKTYVMIKPDGVQRGLVGEIITRFEKKGLKLAALKLLQITPELAGQHYGEHKGKPFFENLVEYITSGPVVAMVWEGREAVAAARKMMGATRPMEAELGTIRADFGMDVERNLIHGSDSVASAEKEIKLFFDPDEVIEYKEVLENWIYG
ncbi:MAG: nucleoside-diphosphate kinase [Clostridia bacterium]|nr:nucleoside-diphosphate kinase [Clostridia bacterium]